MVDIYVNSKILVIEYENMKKLKNKLQNCTKKLEIWNVI